MFLFFEKVFVLKTKFNFLGIRPRIARALPPAALYIYQKNKIKQNVINQASDQE